MLIKPTYYRQSEQQHPAVILMTKSTKSVAFQMDSLAKLNLKFDSTLYVARSAAERAYTLFHYEPSRLCMNIVGGKTFVTATGNALLFEKNSEIPWKLGKEETRNLDEFDVILMRQDPPFELGYITATHVLEHLKGGKTRVVNDPVGVRNAPEKLLVTFFPQFMPPTLVSRDRIAIEAFRNKHKDIIIKPLHGHAGHGIFHLRDGDDNLPALIETMSAMNSEPWMIQKFLPIHQLGDKRIVLLGGEPVGCYTRFPASGDMRGNARVGARTEMSELTKRDHEICAALKPVLCERGLFLAGIDVIGDYMTEINVTSPTGLVVADSFAGRSGKNSIADLFWQKLFG